MFVPPVMILVGGLVFGSLAPILGGLVGAAVVSAVTAATSSAAGVAVCRVVDGATRRLLSRRRQRTLPEARIHSAGASGPRPLPR
jgi:hypothetical protein